jgi:serine/threonine protein kinase
MSEGEPSLSPVSLIGAVLGRYRLERLLGEGGMGAVYAARHQDLGKAAAVKVLHERHDASEQVRVRFLREGQAVSRIRHPNIVDVYDVGSDAGRVYLVMELLEGEDLRSLIAREGPLSMQRTAELLLPVVSAVAAAHEQGVVHRDLKPDNIFLSTERSSIHPKVLDFGISKVSDPDMVASLTGTGTLLGTPYYMSPEQAQTKKNIDARSDQYSLGVILYECVTGRRPIEEPALYQLIQRIVQGDFPAPRQLNPHLSASFERLIQRAMAREPDARFPTTRELGRALLEFASERVRVSYADELLLDGLPHRHAPSNPPAAALIGLGTTLRESVHERDSSGRPAPPRRPKAAAVAGFAIFLGLALTLVWRVSRPSAAGRPVDTASVVTGTGALPSVPSLDVSPRATRVPGLALSSGALPEALPAGSPSAAATAPAPAAASTNH